LLHIDGITHQMLILRILALEKFKQQINNNIKYELYEVVVSRRGRPITYLFLVSKYWR
jgi:hypothetical protein